MRFARPRPAVRSASPGRGRRYARRECYRGRAHHPARHVDGTTTQRGCVCGALVRCHDPRGVHHRRAEVLEPFGGIPVTGDAGHDPDARAAMPGQAEAVITSRGGLGTPRGRSARAWAWPAVAATPEEPASLTSTGRVQGPRWCTSWLAEGGIPPGARPGVVPPGSAAGSCSRRHLRRCAAGLRPWLSAHRVSPRWRRARCSPPRPADPPVARYLAELGRRRGDVGLGGLRQRACRLATPSRRATSRRSGAGPGRSGAIRPESNMYPTKASWLG